MSQNMSMEKVMAMMAENWPESISTESSTIIALMRFNDIVMQQCNQVLVPHGLTHNAFEVLCALRTLPKPQQLTPTDLYEFTVITSGGMTKLINQLQSQGFVDFIDNNKDKRSKLVRLTKKGAQKAEAAMKDVMQQDSNILTSALDSEDVRRLRRILLNCLDKLENN